jgi:alkylation response protein AidB-like acyl-CoA dehydrogenase
VKTSEGWRINGRKIWTSFAQVADRILLLVRTGEPGPKGLSLMLVDMKTPGIDVTPISAFGGGQEFNEVSLMDVDVPADALLGTENGGWQIVTDVLKDERGPEFCLARFADIRRYVEALCDTDSGQNDLGRLLARAFAIPVLADDLLSRALNADTPNGFESLVKLYTTETWRSIGDAQVRGTGTPFYDRYGDDATDLLYESRHYTISAGTSEIQRNQIARYLLALPSSRS